MHRQIISVSAILFATFPAQAALLEVGSTKPYQSIAAAAAAARDGDTISILPGTYTQGAVFRANNLTITAAVGVRGEVKIKDGEVEGKGLFVIRGDNTTVRGLRFYNARVPDGNGAAIRLEGNSISISNSYFLNNENGLLVSPVTGKTGGVVSVMQSTFNGSGTRGTSSPAHGIYVINAEVLSVTNSQFVRQVDGHYIKTRGAQAIIQNNVIDDTYGVGSYLIEVSEGGPATITGNTLTKGTNSPHRVAVSYGEAMSYGPDAQQPAGPVTIENNTYINKKSSSTTFVNNASTPVNPVTLAGNIMQAAAGSITTLVGPGVVNGVVQNGGGEELMADRIEDVESWMGGNPLQLSAYPVDAGFGSTSWHEAPTLEFAGVRVSAVPAPAALGLIALGVTGLAAVRRARSS